MFFFKGKPFKVMGGGGGGETMLKGALCIKLRLTNQPFWWWQCHGMGRNHGDRTALVHVASS